MKTSVIDVHDMLSVLSVVGVEKRIGEVPGVESVTVNYAAGSATVRYDETRLNLADIKSDVRQSGYESDAPTGPSEGGGHKEHKAPDEAATGFDKTATEATAKVAKDTDDQVTAAETKRVGTFTPSTNGAVVYLNAGNDLDGALSRVEAGGGKVAMGKTLISEQIGSIAFFVARDKGFFKDEGLDVQTKTFSSPGDGLNPLLAGDLDAVLSTADSVITVLDKAPDQLKVVYLTDTSAGADAILAKKEITGIKQMKGKKVAATIGQCNHLLLQKALEKAGLTEKDIELVNMNPDDAGAAFAAGKVDVAVTWEPWITKVSGEKKGHVIFSSKETPNLILDVLAISAKTAKTKPEETRAFLKALNRGYDFVKKNTDEAAVVAGKALEQKPEEVKAMLPKVDLYSGKKNLEVMAGPAAKASAQVAKFFKDKKVNDTLVDVNKLYDASFLK